ncbi:MAG TPA: damage-inducible protein [Stellaceae bacterium]
MLTGLREQVRRIERPAATAHGMVSSGVAAIDRALPGGGLARGAVHEILGAGSDEEDGALAAAFAAGILGRLTAAAGGIVLWCLPRPDLYGPGLAVHGLDPARLVLVQARRDADILWAMEEGLRVPRLAAVVGEVGTLAAVASRRLQLAAERCGVTVFLLRRWRDSGEAARERNLPNAAATRWRIAALPSQPIPVPSPAFVVRHPRENGDPGVLHASLATLGPRFRGGDGYKARGSRAMEPGVGRPRWRVELLRCRGGVPACWGVEVEEGKIADATGSLSVVAALADRPAAPIGASELKKFRRTG